MSHQAYNFITSISLTKEPSKPALSSQSNLGKIPADDNIKPSGDEKDDKSQRPKQFTKTPNPIPEQQPKTQRKRINVSGRDVPIFNTDNAMKERSSDRKIFYVTQTSVLPFQISSLVGCTVKKKDENEKKRKVEITLPHSDSSSAFRKVSNPVNVGNSGAQNQSTSSILNIPFTISSSDGELPYDPQFLDDPHLTTGKHRTVMNLDCGVRTSIMPYVSKSKLIEELNDKFAEKHPEIAKIVSLETIRKTKKAILKIGLSADVELSIIASSYIYLEKLILKKYLDKDSLLLSALVCLLLATKYYTDCLPKSKIHAIAEGSSLYERQRVLGEEIKVYKLLNFSLQNDPQHVRSHYIHLQHQLFSTSDSVLLAYQSVLETNTFDNFEE